MFNWLFKKTNPKTKSKKTKIAFTCKSCGFTCEECELAPLCYACHTGNNTFCPGCKAEVV